MSAKTLAQELAEFADGVRVDGTPEDVRESVSMRVLDTLGVAVAATSLPTSSAIQVWATEQGGAEQATAIGVPDALLPATMAAIVNGVLAHSLDFDDTHLPSVLHPSSSVVPAVLAGAELYGASGAMASRAIAVGLEVCVRLGMAGYDEETKNSVFFDHGQHATSICGAMGAAAAVAMLAGGADTVMHALGITASMAAGVIEANRTGGTVKRLHCGWAAHSAVSAVQLVKAGFTGPPTVLEGRFGFFEAWLHGRFDPRQITDALGERWLVPDIFFKPYPANHFTHAAVDAGAALREAGVRPDQIDSLTLGVPEPVLRTVGEPLDVKRQPETGYMAQFSGPYALVVGLLGGHGLGAGLSDYTDELAHDATRRALMEKVDVRADERCTAIFPHEFPAVVRARLNDGSEVVREFLTTRGGPRRPLSFAELATKFRENVAGKIDQPRATELEQICRSLTDLPSVSPLMERLQSTEPLTDGAQR